MMVFRMRMRRFLRPLRQNWLWLRTIWGKND